MIDVLNFFTTKEHFDGLLAVMILLAGCIGHVVSCWRGHD